MNKLNSATRAPEVASLVGDFSMRSISDVAGVARNTIMTLISDLGAAYPEYQDKAFVNLSCKRIQRDEIWSFVGAKQKNATPGAEG